MVKTVKVEVSHYKVQEIFARLKDLFPGMEGGLEAKVHFIFVVAMLDNSMDANPNNTVEVYREAFEFIKAHGIGEEGKGDKYGAGNS